jgi:hypothetical protein
MVNKNNLSWMIALVAVIGAAIWYFAVNNRKLEQPQQLGQEPSPRTAASPPAIRYPIEPDKPTKDSLPSLRESDSAMRDALAGLFGNKLQQFFHLHDIVHRMVATIDNLPRDHAPLPMLPFKPVPGTLVTRSTGQSLALSSINSACYDSYVRLTEAVPTQALVAVYRRFYPLAQEQYENLGYPGKYFNDRLVEVIDHLLEAPEAPRPVLLGQPGVLFEFADPKLEHLSAGQKMLLRMGPQNALKVKTKLREIRQAVLSNVKSG